MANTKTVNNTETEIKKIKWGENTYTIRDDNAVHKNEEKDRASTTAYGVIKVGTGLEINAETGALDVTSAGKVDWTGVENRPFNSVNSEDFTITGTTDADKVLSISSSKWATAQALKDGLEVKLDKSEFNATNIVSTLGTNAVNRANADAEGNVISSTYETKTNVSTELAKKVDKTTYETFANTTVPETYETKSDASTKQKTLQEAIDSKVAKTDFNTYVDTTAPATYLKKDAVASATDLGAIKIGYTEADRKFAVKLDSTNKAYVEVPEYELPNASATTLGGIKIGSGLAISDEGVASVDVDNIDVKWTKVSGKPFSSVSKDFVVSNDALNINSETWLQVSTASSTYETKADATSKKEALEAEIAKKVAQTDFNTFINETAPGKYVAIEGFKTSYLDANNVAYKSDFGNYYIKSEADSKINSEIKSQVLDKKGVASGFATLDENGTVPSSQLPSYVDDVLEYETLSKFPTTGETGKIYVALDTNLTYRWSGTQYVEISASLALGETSSTAYAGDKGKANADNISALTKRVSAIEDKEGNYVLKTTTVNGHDLSGNVTVTKSDVELGNVVNTGDSATPVSGGTTKFTTGGAYTLKSDLETAIDKKQDKLTQGTGIAISSDNTISTNLAGDNEYISVSGNKISANLDNGEAPSLSMSVTTDGVLEISFSAGSAPLIKKTN